MTEKEILPYLDGLEQGVVDQVINNIKKRNEEFKQQSLKKEQAIKDWYKEQMDNNQCFLINYSNRDVYSLIKTFDNKLDVKELRGETWIITKSKIEHYDYILDLDWLCNPFIYENLTPPYIPTEVYDNLVGEITKAQAQINNILKTCDNYCQTLNIKQQ